MRRFKKLEYNWIFKNSFLTTGYTFEDKKGNKYIIWAKDIPNAKWLIGCKDVGDGCYVNEIKPYVSNKHIEGYGYKNRKRPFWYYGRVYML